MKDVAPSSLQKPLLEKLCRRSLYHFVCEGWHVLESEMQFVPNWHIRVVCDEVQKLLEGRSKQNLLINIPPGFGKSLLISVFAPVWQWLSRPAWSGLFLSANPRAYVRDSLKRRDLLRSDWFQETFAPEWKITADQDAKMLFKNSLGGFMQAGGITGAVTGSRVDSILVDDPLDAKDAPSKIAREAVILAWTTAIRNRLTSMVKGTRCVIMQRLHEEDLSGYVLETEPDKWEHLCLPMEFEPERADIRDVRRLPGQLLFEERFPRSVLDEERRNLGSAGYAGQYQQRPAPAEGNRFKREWWRFWSRDGIGHPRPRGCSEASAVRPPEKFDEVLGSWDLAFKDGDDNDWVVGITIGRKGADKFVLSCTREHLNLLGTQRAIIQQRKDFPECVEILIEDKANGPAVIQTLGSVISGLVAVNPEGGKESRAAAIEPQVEAGNIYLPEGAEWLEQWVEEFATFPRGRHDDVVDSLSQALIRLGDSEIADTRALLGF